MGSQCLPERMTNLDSTIGTPPLRFRHRSLMTPKRKPTLSIGLPWYVHIGSGWEAKIRNNNNYDQSFSSLFLSAWPVALTTFKGNRVMLPRGAPDIPSSGYPSEQGFGERCYLRTTWQAHPLLPSLHSFWGNIGPPSIFPPARSSLVSFSPRRDSSGTLWPGANGTELFSWGPRQLTLQGGLSSAYLFCPKGILITPPRRESPWEKHPSQDFVQFGRRNALL